MHASTRSGPSAYRADIDGLRAVAVAAVVVYHAFPAALPGGFVGVDVFFVLSGFLITGILLRGMAEGGFSLAGFYARRVRRIVPALTLVLAATLAAGWWWLSPSDYAALGRHAFAGAAFVPNALSWSEAGYFDVASDAKPLLHLWSLGVEEQFYLVWPWLLLALHRRPRALAWAVGATVVASFACGLFLLPRDPAAAFYLPHARIWQLAVGAWLALRVARGDDPMAAAVPRAWTGPAACAGLALVVSACVLVTPDAPYPGWRAWLPTLGAACLVAAGPRTWLARRVLSARPLVAIGLVSYPLYLWHWPLLSMARLASPGTDGVGRRLALVAVSLVLAWATWRWIERPVRTGAPRLWKVLLPSLALVAVAVAGAAVVRSDGALGRVDVDLQRYAGAGEDLEAGARVGRCWIGARIAADGYAAECVDGAPGDPRPLVVVWGDSHAARLAVGVRAIAGDRMRVAQLTRDGCPALFALRYPRCLEANAAILERVRDWKPATVVLFAFWATPSLPDRDAALDALDASVTRILAAGAQRVVVVGPSAQWDGLEPTLPKNLLRLHAGTPFLRAPRRMAFGTNPLAATLDTAFAARLAGRDRVRYVSALRVFCDGDGCLTHVGDDPYDLVTWDYGHLSASGATHLARAVDAEVGGLAATPSSPTR